MAPKKSKVKMIAVYGGMGLALCSEISASALAGYYLGGLAESKWGGAPWFRVAGLFLFLSVAITHLVMLLRKFVDKEEG